MVNNWLNSYSGCHKLEKKKHINKASINLQQFFSVFAIALEKNNRLVNFCFRTLNATTFISCTRVSYVTVRRSKDQFGEFILQNDVKAWRRYYFQENEDRNCVIYLREKCVHSFLKNREEVE